MSAVPGSAGTGPPAGRRRAGVELEQEADSTSSSEPPGRLEEVDVAADQRPVANDEQLDRRLVIPPGEPDQVERVRAKAAIFWLSIVRPIARTLSRSVAARS